MTLGSTPTGPPAVANWVWARCSYDLGGGADSRGGTESHGRTGKPRAACRHLVVDIGARTKRPATDRSDPRGIGRDVDCCAHPTHRAAPRDHGESDGNAFPGLPIASLTMTLGRAPTGPPAVADWLWALLADVWLAAPAVPVALKVTAVRPALDTIKVLSPAALPNVQLSRVAMPAALVVTPTVVPPPPTEPAPEVTGQSDGHACHRVAVRIFDDDAGRSPYRRAGDSDLRGGALSRHIGGRSSTCGWKRRRSGRPAS